MKKLLLLYIFLILVPMQVIVAQDTEKTIDLIGISKLSTQGLANNSSCTQYEVVGVCLWLVIRYPSGVDIEKSYKVDHFLPDLVVTVYPEAGLNPWTDVRETIDKILDQLGKSWFKSRVKFTLSNGNANSTASHNGDVRVREVSVMGNPYILVTNSLRDAFIHSQASPYMPYYQSVLDAIFWRDFLVELIYVDKFLPGMHEIGDWPNYTWGSLFPRNGFLVSTNEGKTAAVLAYRALNIATRMSLPHFSWNIESNECQNEDCTTAGEFTEKNDKHRWQRLLPEAETECTASLVTESDPDWTKKENGGIYAWNVWREYRGCLPHEGKFIGSFDFPNA